MKEYLTPPKPYAPFSLPVNLKPSSLNDDSNQKKELKILSHPIDSLQRLNDYIGRIMDDAKLLKPRLPNTIPKKDLNVILTTPSMGQECLLDDSGVKNYNKLYLGPISPSKTFVQPSYTLETMPIFLGHLNISTHPDAESLYRLLNVWTHARAVPEKDETIFNALCCFFFEKCLLMEPKDIPDSPIRSLFSEKEWVHSQTFLFVTLLKGLVHGPSDPNRKQSFYETIITKNSDLYLRGIKGFKEIIAKILAHRSYLQLFFKWMNDFDETTKYLCSRLAEVLEINIKVFTLTQKDFKEDNYQCLKASNVDATSNKRNRDLARDFGIFYHKVTGDAYILYSNLEDIHGLDKENREVAGSSCERKFGSIPPLSGLDSTYEGDSTPQTHRNKDQGERYELRYGIVQLQKPRMEVQKQKIEPLYNSPISLPTALLRPQQRNPFIQGIEDLSFYHEKSLDSNWLSNNTSSESLSLLNSQDTNVLPKDILEDNEELNHEALLKIEAFSMSNLSLRRCSSDESKSMSLKDEQFGLWKEIETLDVLDEAWEIESKPSMRITIPNIVENENVTFEVNRKAA